jgi:hypothetical protein
LALTTERKETMRHRLITALTLLGVPFAATQAIAADAAPEGATMNMDFRITIRENAQSEYASSAIERVLNAQCLMQASQPMQIGLGGPTPEQETAANAAAAQSEAISQQMMANMPSEETLAALEAEAEQCGEDEACMMELAMKMQSNSELMGQAQNAGAAAAAAAMPDLGPARYQQWMPQGCTGTLSANDTYVESDPGGEGGYGAYTDTVTVQGSGPVHPDWRGLIVETDLVANTTSLRMLAPPPVVLPSTSSMTGAGQREIPLIGATQVPEILGPLPGILGPGSAETQGPAGTVKVEIQPAQ